MDQAGLRSAVAYVLADLKWEDTLPLDRGVLARSSAAAATVTSRETEQGLAGAEAFFESYQGRYPRQTLLVGPSAAHRLSDAMFAGCRQLADRWQIGMHLHCGEEKPHAVQARVAFGTSLVGHLEALGVLGPDVSLAHGVWLGDDEFEIAARRGVSICHNPASNLKLGSGVARVRRALELRGERRRGDRRAVQQRQLQHVRGAARGGAAPDLEPGGLSRVAVRAARRSAWARSTRREPATCRTRSARWKRASAPTSCSSSATRTPWPPATTSRSSSSTRRTGRRWTRC